MRHYEVSCSGMFQVFSRQLTCIYWDTGASPGVVDENVKHGDDVYDDGIYSSCGVPPRIGTGSFTIYFAGAYTLGDNNDLISGFLFVRVVSCDAHEFTVLTFY